MATRPTNTPKASAACNAPYLSDHTTKAQRIQRYWDSRTQRMESSVIWWNAASRVALTHRYNRNARVSGLSAKNWMNLMVCVGGQRKPKLP